MNIYGITPSSFINGEGCRTVLWVSGCNHCCKECQNLEMQDPARGIPFTFDILNKIIKYVKRPYIDGLTLSGGDPMYPPNRNIVELIARHVKKSTEKSIWMYTGYKFEDIKDDSVINFVDVIVDGPYIEGLPPALYRGSNNQKIWRKKCGIWKSDC